MSTTVVNGKEYLIDNILADFLIQQKSSSNIEFHGSNGKDQIFVQFKNGSSYIYKGVNEADIKEMNEAESIGKFVHALSKKYASEKIPKRVVVEQNIT